jgi:hypothetical protein
LELFVGIPRTAPHRTAALSLAFFSSGRLVSYSFFLPFALLLFLLSGSSWWNFDLIFDTVVVDLVVYGDRRERWLVS